MFMHPNLNIAAEVDWIMAQAATSATRGTARAPVPLEKDIQETIVAWLRRVLPAGSIVQAVRNEAAPRSKAPHARARYHAKRMRAGLAWGFPDLVLIVPGRTLFLELKRPASGEVSATQADMHRRIRDTGHAVGLATGVEEARWFLREQGVPLSEGATEPAREAKVRTVKARIGRSGFRLPADKVPAFDGGEP